MIVISNSTALVHLAAIGHLNLLARLFTEIHIPHQVYQEVVVMGAGKPGSAEVAAADWIKKHAITNQLALRLQTATLGAGEAACLVLAHELKANLLILDDRQARLHAQAQGLSITGTVGILLQAALQGWIDFEPTLQELVASGFRLRESEYQRILELWRKTAPEKRNNPTR